jgi:hypothetical protein
LSKKLRNGTISQEAQKEYLKAHPKSKRRVTAKPKQDTSTLKSKLEEKKTSLPSSKINDSFVNEAIKNMESDEDPGWSEGDTLPSKNTLKKLISLSNSNDFDNLYTEYNKSFGYKSNDEPNNNLTDLLKLDFHDDSLTIDDTKSLLNHPIYQQHLRNKIKEDARHYLKHYEDYLDD